MRFRLIAIIALVIAALAVVGCKKTGTEATGAKGAGDGKAALEASSNPQEIPGVATPKPVQGVPSAKDAGAAVK